MLGLIVAGSNFHRVVCVPKVEMGRRNEMRRIVLLSDDKDLPLHQHDRMVLVQTLDVFGQFLLSLFLL